MRSDEGVDMKPTLSQMLALFAESGDSLGSYAEGAGNLDRVQCVKTICSMYVKMDTGERVGTDTKLVEDHCAASYLGFYFGSADIPCESSQESGNALFLIFAKELLSLVESDPVCPDKYDTNSVDDVLDYFAFVRLFHAGCP